MKRKSQSWSSPLTSTVTLTVQALISSDSSRFLSWPVCLSHLAPIVPMSMRQDGLLVAAELVAHLHVALKGGRHDLVVKLQVLEGGPEGGVAAVVGPVGVNHADLGDRGHAALAGKVALAEGDVREVHGEAQLVDHGLELRLVELQEAVEDLHVGRLGVALAQRGALLEARLARLDGVDDVVLDGCERLVGAGALDYVDLGAAHDGALALGDELDALSGGVGALVKLAGQRLHGEDADVRGGSVGGQLARGDVDLRLGEDHGNAALEELVAQALHVVAVDDCADGRRVASPSVTTLASSALSCCASTSKPASSPRRCERPCAATSGVCTGFHRGFHSTANGAG